VPSHSIIGQISEGTLHGHLTAQGIIIAYIVMLLKGKKRLCPLVGEREIHQAGEGEEKERNG